MLTPLIETERLFLRRPNGADTRAALRFFGSRQAPMVSGGFGAGRARRYMTAFLSQWELRGFGLFAVVPQGSTDAIGIAGPWQPSGWPEPELAWQFWGTQDNVQSLAVESGLALRDFAQSVLGWNNIVSYIRAEDRAAITLVRQMGAVIDPMAMIPQDSDCIAFRHPGHASRTQKRAA
jgi:RimJ/RimL family protein N-acetyltransferase